MRVILLKNIQGVGKAGDIKEVNDGYVRNYLLPHGLAKSASVQAISEMEKQKNAILKKTETELKTAQELAAKLEGMEIIINAKAANEGKQIFGSVNAQKIMDVLTQKGIKIQKDQIKLYSPIKILGEHNIVINIARGFETNIKVIVKKES